MDMEVGDFLARPFADVGKEAIALRVGPCHSRHLAHRADEIDDFGIRRLGGAGPAFCAASDVSTKMPVPITAPMPSRVS